MATPLIRSVAMGAAALASVTALAACGSSSSSSHGKTIALLLPESKTTRYEAFDKPLFEAKVKALCADCSVDYYNADQDESKQAQQVNTAIGKGDSIIVLDPVNGAGAGGMVSSAQASGAKVIAYDRFISAADYYLSFNNETVGKLQAQSLVTAMGGKGSVLELNGAPSDPNAAQFKAGAHSVLDAASGVKILAEYDNPDWSPDNAQKWTTDQLSKFKPAQINGILAANDGQAGGVVAALTGAGVAATALPPITGQDAELAAIQRIITSEQAMTIYKPIATEADKAAELAVALINGTAPSDTTTFQSVKSYIFDPIVVTKGKVESTVIKDGFYTAAQICTSQYTSACTAAGIK